MRVKVIAAACFALLLATVVACQKKPASGLQPSRLMGKLYSGQSLQTVQRQLRLTGGDWDVVEDQRSLTGGDQPASRLYVIRRKDILEYGQNGELVLTFFNDELVGVQFFPFDLDKFRSEVETRDKVAFSSQGDAHIEPSTRVWIGKDQSGRMYVGWIDKQRQAALDNWSRHRAG